jgi:hypothetical protein
MEVLPEKKKADQLVADEVAELDLILTHINAMTTAQDP